jgi:hypothetical protein
VLNRLKLQSRRKGKRGRGSRHLHLLILIDLAAERLRLVTRDTRLPCHAPETESRATETAYELKFFT